MLSKEALKEFEEIWQNDHPGEKIPKERLIEMAQRVLDVVDLAYRQIPRDKIKKFNQYAYRKKS